jgi:hypothetical protein
MVTSPSSFNIICPWQFCSPCILKLSIQLIKPFYFLTFKCFDLFHVFFNLDFRCHMNVGWALLHSLLVSICPSQNLASCFKQHCVFIFSWLNKQPNLKLLAWGLKSYPSLTMHIIQNEVKREILRSESIVKGTNLNYHSVIFFAIVNELKM